MPTGTNFGLNDSLKYTEFEFDSNSTAQSLNNQYYTTDWPLFLMGKPLNNIAAVKILEAQIPFSYYVFNQFNNTFQLTESEGGGTVTATIAEGNYNSATILGAVKAALEAVSPNTRTYTVFFNTASQRLQISSNAGLTRTFTLTFGTNLYDPGWTNPRLWLGFSGGVNTSSTSQVLVAPSVIQLTGYNYVYVNSISLGAMIKLYLPANFGGEFGNSGGQLGADGPQMSKIPITSQPGGVTYWQDPAPLMWFDLENWTSMAQCDFYLTLGDNPQVVELNGNSFSLKLGILTNESSHNDYLGGGKANSRVQTRQAPRGFEF